MASEQMVAHEAQAEKNRAALTSVIAAVCLTAMKLVVGCLTGSLGILSEAAHSGLDLVAAVVTALAVRISDKPADGLHQFGHGKVENFSALFETLLLLGTCLWIIYEAIRRITSGHYGVEVSFWSFVVILTSITIDVNRSAMLYRTARKHHSQALEADALHFSSDILSSGVVLVGLVMVKFGFPIGDPIAALGVALLVITVSCRLGKRTIDALLDTAPNGITIKVIETVANVPGVIKCDRARIRQAGAQPFVDVRVELAPDLHMEEVEGILHNIEGAVRTILPGADVTPRPVSAQQGVS